MATGTIKRQPYKQLNTSLGPLISGDSNSYVSIPNFSSLSDMALIVIITRRYAYSGTYVTLAKTIREGNAANGSMIYLQSANKHVTMKISQSGAITITDSTADGDQYLDIFVID